MVPLLAARVSPVGRLPAVIDHVYAGVPPEADIAFEYAVPAVPEGSVALIVKAGAEAAATTIERGTDLDCAGLPPSVTVAVKLLVPFVVGVPEMRPVPWLRLSPAGRLPAVMDQA